MRPSKKHFTHINKNLFEQNEFYMGILLWLKKLNFKDCNLINSHQSRKRICRYGFFDSIHYYFNPFFDQFFSSYAPWKHQKTLGFLVHFQGYKIRNLARNGLKYVNTEVSSPAFIQLPALCTKTAHVPPSQVLNSNVLEYGPQPFTVLSFTLTSYLLK